MAQNNASWVEVVKEALGKLVPFLLGWAMTKNNTKDNANDLVKKAKKAVGNRGGKPADK
jgi:hypothetical protein